MDFRVLWNGKAIVWRDVKLEGIATKAEDLKKIEGEGEIKQKKAMTNDCIEEATLQGRMNNCKRYNAQHSVSDGFVVRWTNSNPIRVKRLVASVVRHFPAPFGVDFGWQPMQGVLWKQTPFTFVLFYLSWMSCIIVHAKRMGENRKETDTNVLWLTCAALLGLLVLNLLAVMFILLGRCLLAFRNSRSNKRYESSEGNGDWLLMTVVEVAKVCFVPVVTSH